MATFGEALRQARELLTGGRFSEAQAVYRQLVAADPGAVEAWHELGIAHLQAGQSQAAVDCIGQAVKLEPASAAYQANLGTAHRQLGQPREARACFERAIELGQPTAELCNNLALTLKETGFADAALAAFDRALGLRPDYANGHFNRGNLLMELGRAGEAVASYREAIRFQANDAAAHCKLGMAYFELGELDKAVACFTKAVDLQPNYPEALSNLGVVLRSQGRLDDAVRCLQHALALQPDLADAHNNLGAVFEKQEKNREAIDCFRSALQCDPKLAEASAGLATQLALQGDVDAARECYGRALELYPENDVWRINQAVLCPAVFSSRREIESYRARLREDIESFSRRELRLGFDEGRVPDCAPAFHWQFHGCDDRPLREAYARMFRCPAGERPVRGSPTGRRIGFVVTDRHEGLFLRSLGGIIHRLDAKRFEPVLIGAANGVGRLRDAVGRASIELLGLPDKFPRAVEAIRAARLDLLYYWEVGTDSTNYFLPFHRLAPVQCTSWGIQVTSGIAALDYYLSSALVEPGDAPNQYSERLLLADTLLSWQPRASLEGETRPREFYGIAADRHWYVCAQQLGKLHPDFDAILAGILRADQRALIVLVRDRRDTFAVGQLQARFAAHMADVAERIVFLPFQPPRDYLALIAAADVLLDPLHFGGVNSTYDGFSLGQPIVTLPSQYQRGRYTLGCYAKMGVLDCVATTASEYVKIAVALGTDKAYRHEVVEKIRRASPSLFEDLQAVREHERLFDLLLEQARTADHGEGGDHS